MHSRISGSIIFGSTLLLALTSNPLTIQANRNVHMVVTRMSDAVAGEIEDVHGSVHALEHVLNGAFFRFDANGLNHGYRWMR